MQTGLYESLITQLLKNELKEVEGGSYYIQKTKLDREEAASVLARHIGRSIQEALSYYKGDLQIEQQIEVSNKILQFLKEEIRNHDYQPDLVELEGEILKAIIDKTAVQYSDFSLYLKERYPYTRLTQSELFTGGNVGLSMESELKKEIRSADAIDLLVSFIKFKGVVTLLDELREFTDNGGKLRILTTTYMGASDYKAIKLLAELKNTEVKISYNTGNERLHAKAYLFHRKTGFDTAYIGSSNFSRTALTDGLEWNLKITTHEISHIIQKFKKTFEAYWDSDDFELYVDDVVNSEKLIQSLGNAKGFKKSENFKFFFEIKPYPFQSEILEKLEVERTVHNRYRNLVVAATGTGKTVISAFDYNLFRKSNGSAKLLYLAHRKEILLQAISVFRGIVQNNNLGELWVDGETPDRYEHVFASVQTLKNRIETLSLSPDYYDFIIIDECHHLKANSYRGIINYFKPKILLGLTATPERMDGEDITEDFENRIAAEIRLPEALNRKLLCPFQYFGITDSVDLSKATWERGTMF